MQVRYTIGWHGCERVLKLCLAITNTLWVVAPPDAKPEDVDPNAAPNDFDIYCRLGNLAFVAALLGAFHAMQPCRLKWVNFWRPLTYTLVLWSTVCAIFQDKFYTDNPFPAYFLACGWGGLIVAWVWRWIFRDRGMPSVREPLLSTEHSSFANDGSPPQHSRSISR